MRWKKSGSNVWMAVVGLSGALWSLSLIQAQDAESAIGESGRNQGTPAFLSHRLSVPRPDLLGINRMVISSDNRFLYAAPWRGNSLVSFQLGREGEPEYLNSLTNPMLQGVIKLSLSRDEKRLAGICLRSNTILLFGRDEVSGRLTPDGFSRKDLAWPVSVQFSPDGQHLYVCDAGRSGTSDAAPSAVVVYKILDGGGLEEVDRAEHPDLDGSRDLLLDSAGKHCYVSCSTGGCIVVFKRDPASGELRQLQTIRDDAGPATLLDGVHSAVMNKEESRVYFIAGRFRGQSGLSVFRRQEGGELEFESQIALDPAQFGGGNHLAVTADESRIIVSGTTGDSIAVIRQDLAERGLEVEAYIHDDAQAGVLLNGPSGLAFDTTQKYLYVAAEDGSALTMFDLRQ